MHIERVATRRPARPSRPAQALAAHDTTEPGDEGGRQAGFDRRERHPTRTEAEHPVAVEVGDDVVVGAAARLEPGRARADVVLGRGDPGPVLEAIGGDRWLLTRFDEEQAGGARGDERVATRGLGRPAE